MVAEGGSGSPCVLKDNPAAGGGRKGRSEDDFALTDDELREMVLGQPGQAVTLQLMLRTVADVGFVGFPNAGEIYGRYRGDIGEIQGRYRGLGSAVRVGLGSGSGLANANPNPNPSPTPEQPYPRAGHLAR